MGKKHKNNFTIPEREEKKKENYNNEFDNIIDKMFEKSLTQSEKNDLGKLLHNKKYEDSILFLDKILKTNRTETEILIYLKGDCYFHLNDYKNALENYEIILNSFSNNLNYLTRLTQCYNFLRKYDLVIKYSEKILELDEFNLPIIVSISNAYNQFNNYEKSITYSEKMLYTNEPIIWIALLSSYFGLKQYDKCIYYGTKILKKESQNIPANYLLAVIYKDILDLKKSLYHIDEIINNKNITQELDKLSRISMILVKCEILYDTYEYKQAENIIKEAFNELSNIKINDSLNNNLKDSVYADYYYIYSLIIHKNRLDEAIEYLLKATEIQNNNHVFFMQLAIYYYLKNEKKKFKECLKKSKEYSINSSNDKNSYIQLDSIIIPTKYEIKIPEEILFDLLDEIEKTREEKIVAGFSHSIKNIIGGSITSQLNLFKENKNMNIIDDVQKGVNIITNIVEAMNLSSSGKLENFIIDSTNTNENDENMEKIIINSFEFSIDNMFDSHYYSHFKEEYFPEKEIYIKSKEEFINLNSFEKLQKFLNKNMFNFNYHFDENILKYKISDENKSKTKLLLLFQEIIFNAVKYAAFVEKNKRYLNISLKKENNEIIFSVKNSCSVEKLEKSTGIGKTVIENICKIFNTKLIMQKENNEFVVIVKIPDFWKEKNE